jgi:hypothetical protein
LDATITLAERHRGMGFNLACPDPVCCPVDMTSQLVSLGTTLIAAVGAFLVYLEYTRQKHWRTSDLASSLMRELESNDELAFACLSLDWGVGSLIVPERYRPLMRMCADDDAVVQHSPRVMAVALEPMLNAETLEHPPGLICRHCFVKLFNHLDNIGRLLASKQIGRADLDGLDYWLRQLSNYQYAELAERDGAQVFQPALAAFNYPRIPALGRELGVNDWRVFDELAHEGG